MAVDLTTWGTEFAEFWQERLLCTLSTVRPDGTPHVVPVGVTVDLPTGIARVITSGTSHKARLARAAGPTGVPVAVCQVDGRRWSTLTGTAVLREDPESVRDAEQRYARRYRQPRPNPQRVVLRITVHQVMGTLTKSTGHA
jgi:PPOX class probable F420-dependent enzyme